MDLIESEYVRYLTLADSLVDGAIDNISQYIQGLNWSEWPDNEAEITQQVQEYFKAVVDQYGDASATAAANIYDEMARAARVKVPMADLADPIDPKRLEASVADAIGDAKEYGPGARYHLADLMAARTKRFVNEVGSQTISRNAQRDRWTKKVRFARVPQGRETCGFCIMLASRGFVYATEHTAGMFKHYHDNCDCRIMPGFGRNPHIVGYDPDYYYGLYSEAVAATRDPTNPSAPIDKDAVANYLRRNAYGSIKDERNARRRELYARRKQEAEYGVAYGTQAISADESYINSNEYRDKFNGLANSPYLDNMLFECAREAIMHNNGTNYESMYMFDADTGDLIGVSHGTLNSGVEYTPELERAVAESRRGMVRLAVLHNHPQGTPPSGDDFRKAYENRVEFGLVVGHNGQVYKYKNNSISLSIQDCDIIAISSGTLINSGADVDRAYTEVLSLYGLRYEVIHSGTY